MSNNRLLGGVRFRQLRAAPNRGCKVPNDLKDVIASCYASGYSDRNKDTAPFGPPSDPQRYAGREERGRKYIFVLIDIQIQIPNCRRMWKHLHLHRHAVRIGRRRLCG